jgi:hypothetical protein
MKAEITAYRILAGIQGSYFLLTGVWPLLHMSSFLAVTGPKTDLWLVETVGILVAAIGAGLLLSAIRATQGLEIPFIAVLASLGLMAIDVIYTSRGVISKIYLADAVPEILFVVAWIGYALYFKRR